MKKQYTIASIAMILLVLMDATGDALRLRHAMIAHHGLELAQIVAFFAVWALFGFKKVYIALYILARVALFNLMFNLVAGLDPLYVGSTSGYDLAITWVTGLFKSPPSLLAIMLTFLATLAWVGTYLKYKR